MDKLERNQMNETSEVRLTITATDRKSLDRQLDAAVAIAREQAMPEGRRGILVTRHGPDAFTVALSDDVPFGLTREQQDW